MRWVTPLLFIGAGAYVWYYNSTHADSKLLFPFLQAIYDGTLEQLGTVSALLFLSLGALFTVLAVRGALRDRQAPPDEG